MPTQKAAFRAQRKSKKNALRNKNVMENIKYLLKQDEKTSGKNNAEKTKESIEKTIQAIDRAAQKGILKKNTAARKKSRIMKKFNSLSKAK
ncbi:MAG: 30S ribosomal protein S20 [Parcubacteria group bacterium GW2011_GWA2_38_13]|nr:MAG: 30S ribosomal protein S20 [Parcubacteria group bacterium GW2011_GWA2_38_13]